eukprot:757522-Hanusia_phi.AAC.2
MQTSLVSRGSRVVLPLRLGAPRRMLRLPAGQRHMSEGGGRGDSFIDSKVELRLRGPSAMGREDQLLTSAAGCSRRSPAGRLLGGSPGRPPARSDDAAAC